MHLYFPRIAAPLADAMQEKNKGPTLFFTLLIALGQKEEIIELHPRGDLLIERAGGLLAL